MPTKNAACHAKQKNQEDKTMSAITEERARQIAEEVLQKWLRYGLNAFNSPNLTQTPPKPTEQSKQPFDKDNILNNFPSELQEKLVATKTGDVWKIQLKHYYQDDTWGKVNDIIRSLGGKWVKNEQDKKQSCWMV